MGAWTPDAPALGNTGLVDVVNAVPGKEQWLPQRGPAAVSSQGVGLPIQGIWTANRSAGDPLAFVASAGAIFLISSSTDPLTNVSRAGGYDAHRERALADGPERQSAARHQPQRPDPKIQPDHGRVLQRPEPERASSQVHGAGARLHVVANTVDPVDGPQVYRHMVARLHQRPAGSAPTGSTGSPISRPSTISGRSRG